MLDAQGGGGPGREPPNEDNDMFGSEKTPAILKTK